MLQHSLKWIKETGKRFYFDTGKAIIQIDIIVTVEPDQVNCAWLFVLLVSHNIKEKKDTEQIQFDAIVSHEQTTEFIGFTQWTWCRAVTIFEVGGDLEKNSQRFKLL